MGWEALDDGHGTTAAVGPAKTTCVAAEPTEDRAHVDGYDRPIGHAAATAIGAEPAALAREGVGFRLHPMCTGCSVDFG